MSEKILHSNRLEIKRIHIHDVKPFLSNKEVRVFEEKNMVDPITNQILENPFQINFQKAQQIQQKEYDTRISKLSKKIVNENLKRRYERGTLEKIENTGNYRDPFTNQYITSIRPDENMKIQIQTLLCKYKRKIRQKIKKDFENKIKGCIKKVVQKLPYNISSVSKINVINLLLFEVSLKVYNENRIEQFIIGNEKQMRKHWQEENLGISFQSYVDDEYSFTYFKTQYYVKLRNTILLF
jgi:hypothetical protein